jgi:hypothetical protein
VSVGKTTTIDAMLPAGKFAEAITVEAAAPLFDQTSPSHGSNLPAEQLAVLPNDRNFIEAVDTAAGFDNRMAYGAGGNVDGYDYFGFGAATNSYQLNGVSVSNLEFGNSWVNPNYDAIQEIQIVGPGGTAEYSNYSGATVNVVTKAGTNEYSGSIGIWYTDDSLTDDNSGGILDLEHPTIDRNNQYSATLGGPLVREKLLFFASVGYTDTSDAPPGTEFYNSGSVEQYQVRLDFLASPNHTLAAMVDYSPILLDGLGGQNETGPETMYYREQDTTTGYLSWLGTWGANTMSELRFAAVDGSLGRIQNAPLDVVGVYDGRTGVQYNAEGFNREQYNDRQEGKLAVTHFVDDFIGGSHEFKAGVEYETSSTTTDFVTSGNTMINLMPIGSMTYIWGLTGYNSHQVNDLKRTGVFVQDRATFKRATVSIGLRYDNPETTDGNTGKTLLKFEQFSPRLGVTYDFAGNGRSVGRVAVGRYYDKVPTYGIGTYAGTGFDPITYYGAFTDQPIDPTDWQAIVDTYIQPEYITSTFNTQSRPVEDGIEGPRTDAINLGFEQQLGEKFALSFNYIYRKTEDYIVLTAYANPYTYAPVTYTHPFNDQTFTFYTVTGGGPLEEGLGNRDFNFQKSQMFMVELRARPTGRWYLGGSLALEDTVGTRDNNECGILSLCSNGRDGNPNIEQNPFETDGPLSQERPWNVKLQASYSFPFGLTAGGDFRWFSGRAYGAQDYCFNIPECNDPYYFYIRIEPRDARHEDDHTFINLRLSQDIKLGGGLLTAAVDVLNATNEAIDWNTNIQGNINSVYSKESGEQGELVSSFGQPYSVANPRQCS